MTKTVTLGEICEIYGGGTPSREIKEYFGGGIPWLTPTEIPKDRIGQVASSKETLTQEGLSNSSAKLLPVGSVLMTSRASIGNIAIANTQVTTNQGFISFVCPPTLFNKYLAYWLFTQKGQFENAANGATFKEISRGTIKEFSIPLPSLPEQRRIAALLDRADALRQKDRQLLAHYDQLAQSLFLDMFGNPVKNEKGWEVKKIGNVIKRIESGWSPVCHEKPRSNKEEWAVLKLGAVTSRYFKANENKLLPDTLAPRPEIEVKLNDVLFSRKNTKELVGACVYIFENSSRLMMSDTIFRLVRDDLKINGIFLWYLINDKSLRQEIQKLATGSSGSMPNISKERLLDFKIPIPPLSLQTQFAQLIEQIEKQKDVVRRQMAASEALFGRLLQQCFG